MDGGREREGCICVWRGDFKMVGLGASVPAARHGLGRRLVCYQSLRLCRGCGRCVHGTGAYVIVRVYS